MTRFATITTFYVAAILISELMAAKVVHLGWYIGPAAVIMYPFTFMLADVITELFGGQTARKVVGMGFVTLIVFVVWTSVGTFMPSLAAPSAQANAAAYNVVFGFVPRIVSASLVAYVVGETLNVTIMSWLRNQRWFGARTILSTSVGQLFDSMIFITIAFIGTVPGNTLVTMIITQYVAKVLIEACLGTPMAYLFVRWIRKSEISQETQLVS
jgi:queuosine precursor transporter